MVAVVSSGSCSAAVNALGRDHVAGVQKGTASHSQWSGMVKVENQARSKDAGCIIPLGAGSLTDAARLVVFARLRSLR